MIKKSQYLTLGQVRIIGGQWRGRKLPVINSPGLRPTPDRVRETLFNWLEPIIKNSRCLDCFAGSGVLGLEALSRYAKSTTLLEVKNNVSQQLINNLTILKADNGFVINTNTLFWLEQKGRPYDVIFLDPPFRQGLLTRTIYLLEKRKWLSNEAWIYVENTSLKDKMESFPSYWKLHRRKTAGQIIYRLYIRSQ